MECHATNPERCSGELGREEAIFTPLEKKVSSCNRLLRWVGGLLIFCLPQLLAPD